MNLGVRSPVVSFAMVSESRLRSLRVHARPRVSANALRLGALATALALTGCAGSGALFSNTVGAGAKSVVRVVAGPSANEAFLGPRIAKALDADAEVQASAAQYRALETAQTGSPITWLHDHVYGTVTPGPYVAVKGEARCRTYSHTIYVKSEPHVTRGVACRHSDATWVRIGPLR